MSTITATPPNVQPWRRRLYLPAYQVSDAARYGRTHANTVSSWLYRPSRRGPVLPGKKRRVPLSYFQLVEVAFVAVFRRLGVPMANIRKAREYMEQRFSAEYPFAEYKFLTEGFNVLAELGQFEPNEEQATGRLIVANASGQIAWQDLMAERFEEFDYEKLDGVHWAMKWHPAGKTSKVIIDPRIAFGAPTVLGIPTWAIKGRWNAREEIDEIGEDFGLAKEYVIDGLMFEGIKVVELE